MPINPASGVLEGQQILIDVIDDRQGSHSYVRRMIRVLRRAMSKTPPLKNLSNIAKTEVPLLHLCGNLTRRPTSL